jgi:hypothetical protein
MPTHSYNHGIVTSAKGLALESVTITGMDASPCTVDEQFNSNLVDEVTISTGVVSIQLNAPYPPRCKAIAGYTSALATTDIITPRVKSDGYDADTGILTVYLSNDDDSGAPVAASPAAADELTVFLMCGRYTHA